MPNENELDKQGRIIKLEILLELTKRELQKIQCCSPNEAKKIATEILNLINKQGE